MKVWAETAQPREKRGSRKGGDGGTGRVRGNRTGGVGEERALVQNGGRVR